MPTMNSTLGGPEGYGENVYSTSAKVAGNNDDGSVEIDVTSIFGEDGINFFGTEYTSLYVNSNGLITFDSPQTSYTPSGITELDEPAIAPFWTDVDVNKGGEIYWDVDEDTEQITITWANVAPYMNAGSGETNSFQVVLTNDGNGDFTVKFVYEDIQWTDGYRGDATVGVTDGGSMDFELEGSGVETSLDDFESNDFDVGLDDGIWSFSVRDGLPDYRDYVVEGTDDAEIIDVSFIDEDGDRVDSLDNIVDTNDDEIAAGGGDDSVLAGLGDDTVRGDEGDDTLLGEAGDDIISGGTGDDRLIGGVGDDTLTGGAGNDTFVYAPGDGSDIITDFNAGNTGALDDGDSSNNDFVDFSSYYDNLSELYADQADDGVLNQSNITGPNAADYSDNDQFAPGEGITILGASADSSSFTTENTGVVCFTTGTAIRTPQGDVLIDDLKVGDLVSTVDNGPKPLRWIGTTSLGASELAANPKIRPILISRGILGAERDLLVSPQHGMVIGADYLARATHLATTTKGIRIANGKKKITYVHLMFDAHQLIFAENIPSESFYPGPTALKMMNASTREEIFAILPELMSAEGKDSTLCAYGPTAREFIHKRLINGDLKPGVANRTKQHSTFQGKNRWRSIEWPTEPRH
jgi:Ca2+-binding RTX toxin-like protein